MKWEDIVILIHYGDLIKQNIHKGIKYSEYNRKLKKYDLLELFQIV